MRYCLIGEKLSHSFSKEIHTVNGLAYEHVELKKSELEGFVKNNDYNGYNVTIPYKTEIIKYLDKVDESAKNIGAVNTVVKENGLNVGYNTDVFGMKKAIERLGVSLTGKTVLVLGSGGTSLTARALLQEQQAKKVYVVSRTGEINYNNCYDLADVEIIINTTPLGTFPNNDDCPIDVSRFANLKAVFDCIYNPLETVLVRNAKKLNLFASTGLYMLVAQACKAEELWQNERFNQNQLDKIYAHVKKSKENLVLEGMPSSGKSTVGKLLAKALNRQFIDTDSLIEKECGVKIEQIFNKHGEEYFRQVESDIIKKVSKLSGVVIAIGGGSPIREENRLALKQNGIVYYIKRNIENLVSDNRPLSKAKGVLEIYNERKEIYENFADYVIVNDKSPQDAVEEILKNENTRY